MIFPAFQKEHEEIESLQLKKMKRIVGIAYNKSNFYHQYYKNNGFHPEMLRTYDDIKRIPVVKRSILKNCPVENIVTVRDFSKLHLHTTSGSSGIPIKFYFTKKEELLKNYGVLRAYLQMGMSIHDRTIALRDPIEIRKRTLYEKLGFIPYDYYNIYAPIEDIYHSIINKYSQIDVLKGMPSDLLNLCYVIRKENGKFPKVKLLISDAEVLDSFSRKYISDTLGVEVLDYYGSVECGCIAFQMRGSDKYFVNEDQVLLENGSANAETGDAIITNLRNTTFPVIRYQIGDVIDFGDGKSDISGINTRTINKIQGKYLDFIVLPDGTIISPHIPKQEMTHLNGIKKFQIVQEKIDRVKIRIERDYGYSEELESQILQSMNKVFKNQILCTVEYDDSLSKKSKNKFKCIQSDIAQTFLSERQ